MTQVGLGYVHVAESTLPRDDCFQIVIIQTKGVKLPRNQTSPILFLHLERICTGTALVRQSAAMLQVSMYFRST